MKGQLRLSPLTESRNIVWNAVSSPYVVTKSAKPICWLESPSKVKSERVGDWKKDTLLSAFWYVQVSTDETAANMKIVKIEIGGYMFPMLENSRALKTFDKLMSKTLQLLLLRLQLQRSQGRHEAI